MKLEDGRRAVIGLSPLADQGAGGFDWVMAGTDREPAAVLRVGEENEGADPIRVVAVDDHPLIHEALAVLVAREIGLEIVASCTSGLVALDAVRRWDPHVVLLDLRMPGLDGLGVMRRLAATGSMARVVLLAAEVSDAEASEAFLLGVRGIVLKDEAPGSVVEAIRRVYNGEMWIKPVWIERVLHFRAWHPATPDSPLTSREREVAGLAAGGLRNKEIAQALSLAEGTVKLHLHNVYDKLGLSSRFDLIRGGTSPHPAELAHSG